MIELPILDGSDGYSVGNRRVYWRSEAQRVDDASYSRQAEREFMPGADEKPVPPSRRQFLQVMGASMALAGLSACRRPVETIVPFVRKPEELVPGIPVNYATSMPFRGHVRGILVESSDGRPTKIEGNPDHPDSSGATGIFEQASLLGLYDPDRSQQVLRNGSAATWAEFVAFSAGLPDSSRVAVIAGPDSSATRAELRSRIENRFASVRWVEYAAEGGDTALQASKDMFGRTLRPRYHLKGAKTILSLDADFLGATCPDMPRHTGGFAAGRIPETEGSQTGMNRLYAVESQYSVTGAAADNRLRLRSSDVPAFAAALARAFGMTIGGGEEFSGHPFVRALADDLQDAGPAGVVIPGETQPKEVHAMAAAINEHLGAVGSTVTYLDTGEDDAATRTDDLRELTGALKAGRIDLLVILDGNPVYDAPADLDFAEAFSAASETVHLGLHVDETAGRSSWHLPAAHYLEAWGDGRSFDGTRSVQQPLIAPLYEAAHSAIEVLSVLASGVDSPGYDQVRSTWQTFLTGDFETSWQRVLHDGFLPDSGYDRVQARVNEASLPALAASSPASGYEVVVRLDDTLLDGSYANNAWLQELPHPTTKVVWDNVAVMSPATADELGVGMELRNGRYFVDRISISAVGGSIDLPVWIQPGVADGSIDVRLGYGREIASNRPERHTNLFDLDDYTDVYGHGAVAAGVGVSISAIRSSDALSVITGASVARSGTGYLVASTQDHGALPVEGLEVERRGLYRSVTAREYEENPEFMKELEPEPIREAWEDYPALWQKNHPTGQPEFRDNDFNQFQWGMVIDLNACTGCNACVVACQAENNVQVVGKEEVSRGREMHWIRMDRYFVSGDDGSYEDPRLVMQPIPCMHCENAPCEQVCPVAATVHSPDGTNQMVYNRCIGTRYCANNCPYKVRRFNFYNWTKTLPESVRMTQNPNVTVRSRGVMEKCSFCIQRVREVNKKMNIEKRAMATDEVQTACQQVCPARAITFGDLADATSAVNDRRKSKRRYEMLAELGVLPRTSYLARVRNPNPLLEPEA